MEKLFHSIQVFSTSISLDSFVFSQQFICNLTIPYISLKLSYNQISPDQNIKSSLWILSFIFRKIQVAAADSFIYSLAREHSLSNATPAEMMRRQSHLGKSQPKFIP